MSEMDQISHIPDRNYQYSYSNENYEYDGDDFYDDAIDENPEMNLKEVITPKVKKVKELSLIKTGLFFLSLLLVSAVLVIYGLTRFIE